MQIIQKFGPREQTPEQRRKALAQALAMSRGQGVEPEEIALRLYDRYVSGELTMREVTAALKEQEMFNRPRHVRAQLEMA